MAYIKFKKDEIHEVCLRCAKDCKKPWTFWSGIIILMRDKEYCDQFEGREDLIGKI